MKATGLAFAKPLMDTSSISLQTMLRDPGAMLTALGICSGDLLWVHPPAGTAVLMDCDQLSATRAAAAPAVPARESLAAAMPTVQPPDRQAAADAAEARRRAAMQVIVWATLTHLLS